MPGPGPAIPASMIPSQGPAAGPAEPPRGPQNPPSTGPLNPNRVFGIGLMEYWERAQEYVPVLVTQCIQALSERGEDVPNLYTPAPDPTRNLAVRGLADAFMNVPDARNVVTWENPSLFNGDPTVLAELICYWLDSLPEPLIDYSYQSDCYASITAHQTVLLHKTINELPNPHYATLHRITYHLRCVAQTGSGGVPPPVTIETMANRFG